MADNANPNHNSSSLVHSFKPTDVYLVKKKHVYILVAVVCLLFVGSILATYYGATAGDEPTEAMPVQMTTTIAATTSKSPTINYRLPGDLKPYLYDLYIKPYIGPDYGALSFTFEGKMTMKFVCLNSTNKIVFHVEELDIDEAKVKLTDSVTRTTLSFQRPFSYDKERLFVIIQLNDFLKSSNNYSLEVPYSGNISSNLYGFYKGSYTVADNTY